MDDQYSGNMLNELMDAVSRKAFPRRPVIGSKIVTVNGVKFTIGPEVINALNRFAARKEQAKASGKPPAMGVWQTKDPEVKAQMRAMVAEVGLPGLFD